MRKSDGTSAFTVPLMDAQSPEPTFASVRIEFADGTFREFHVYKPLRADIDISPGPLYDLPFQADLGAVPPGMIAPSLPEISVRIKAGHHPEFPVMTMDSRTADRAGTTAEMIRLLSSAYEALKMDGTDEATQVRRRHTMLVIGAFLGGMGR
jgi:hypothetical protein